MIPVWMRRAVVAGGLVATLGALCGACADGGAPTVGGVWSRTADGVIVTPAEGPAATVRLQVFTPAIVRVTRLPAGGEQPAASLMVVASPTETEWRVGQRGDRLTLATSEVTAEVSLASGGVTFRNRRGEEVLAEFGSGSFEPVDVHGERFFAVRQEFNRGTDEGFYGLGQHQNGQFDYNGEDVELAQHNIVAVVPFVVSTRNYGVLWDNNGISRFGDPSPYEPLDATLRVYDEDGGEGGLTGRYYQGDELVATRIEADPDYQYLPADQYLRPNASRGAWPEELGGRSASRVVWTGSIESDRPGRHKFQLYASSYFQLWIGDQKLLDGWRQNWNPWYHAFELDMRPGERRALRIEWLPNDGYLRLLHRDPLPADERHELSLSSEVARAIDYYFVAGNDLDQVIAGYRRLTGAALLLPRWAYGFWQSRQRYTTQQELLDVVHEYRRRRIPLDNIVLDWFYWPEDAWGSHHFDAQRFPDPRAMVDEVHRLAAHIMISVWPKFYPSTANFRELDAAGHIYRRQLDMASRDWVGPGYASAFYDPYSEEARRIYWRQIQESLGVLGFDAWWLDATEPDSHSNLDYEERALRMGPNALGSGEEYFNSYVLLNSQAVFEGQQSVAPDDRVFILTRSTWGGLQRYASAHWSGDVAARWDDLRNQIPAGINMAMSGLPNWTHDIGGFAVEDRYARQDPAHLGEWRELYLRWFQFGAFSPLFRSHGEFPYRETYNIAPAGSEVYESLLYYHHLRYRLLPYIYTLAGDTFFRDGTILRGLVMDFPDDPRVRGTGDQYLFGPALLVAPVTAFDQRSRPVYLPEGADWYDFYTGDRLAGGRDIAAAAPLAHIPLFVRAGSILPLGPDVQYADENLDGPIRLLIFPGSDGAFELYEDDGETYAHQRGEWTRIPLTWDDAAGVLTIGARRGSYPGMVGERTFEVRWISDGAGDVSDLSAPPDETVRYRGDRLQLVSPASRQGSSAGS